MGSPGLHKTIGNNKHLLGVFPENGNREKSSKEDIKEAEIHPDALRRHILSVRAEIRQCLEEKSRTRREIAKQVLQDLTSRLDITDMGEVFGRKEQQEWGQAFNKNTGFGDEDSNTGERYQPEKDPILEKLKSASPEDLGKAHQILMERLRKGGKIQ